MRQWDNKAMRRWHSEKMWDWENDNVCCNNDNGGQVALLVVNI